MKLLVLNLTLASNLLAAQVKKINERSTMLAWRAKASFTSQMCPGSFSVFVEADSDVQAYMAKGFVLGTLFGRR